VTAVLSLAARFGPSELLAGDLPARENDRKAWRTQLWTFRDGV